MKKIADRALYIYLVVIFFMLMKSFLPLGETIQTTISFLSVVVVLGVFIVEKKVHKKKR
jgi:drug/metabolite transporter (DMT)-like permease